jgi:hypothetical protein
MKKIITNKFFWIISMVMLVTMCNYVSNEEVCKRLTSTYDRSRAQELENIANWVNQDTTLGDTLYQLSLINRRSKFLIQNDSTIEFKKMKDILFSLNNVPRSVLFNKYTKTTRFVHTGSFAPNKIGEHISVVFVGKKVSPAICVFKDAFYPPWYLDEWVYEIKPQWYVLYNTSSNEFVRRCDSLNNIN